MTIKYKPNDQYEILPDIFDEEGLVVLSATYSANNGIRISLLEESEDPDWRVFDFTDDQAELIGNALIRWVKRNREQ